MKMVNWVPQRPIAKDAQRGRRGFTLVELLISIAVISILAGLAAQTFRAILDSREVAMTRMAVSETARASLEFMASELSSAYLTPDSVKPAESRTGSSVTALERTPRFRFAGISRDLTTKDYPDVPGAGIDDDGDGLIDEEILDGVDGDYPGGNFRGRPVSDPLGCDDPNDPMCIDEDIGMFPSDILHFVSAIENEGNVVLQEISYGLDPTGTRLVRRAVSLDISQGGGNRMQMLANFGQFIDQVSGNTLLPRAVPIGQRINSSDVRKSMTNWDIGSREGTLYGQNLQRNNASQRIGGFNTLAYDIRGLRFRYWYYDYNRGGWRIVQEWDSARETALMAPGEMLFNKPALNNSFEGRTRGGFENIIVNEPDDIFPKGQGGRGNFLVTNPMQILNTPDYRDSLERIARRTDGLPNMVEIVIYVQDRERSRNPRPYTTRVFIPNNYRSLGT